MSTLEFGKVKLVETCFACPEQYDAVIEGEIVGYFRLRYGKFTVQLFGPSGEEVYTSNPEGDGIFAQHERNIHLQAGVDALVKQLLTKYPALYGDLNDE